MRSWFLHGSPVNSCPVLGVSSREDRCDRHISWWCPWLDPGVSGNACINYVPHCLSPWRSGSGCFVPLPHLCIPQTNTDSARWRTNAANDIVVGVLFVRGSHHHTVTARNIGRQRGSSNHLSAASNHII